MKKIILLPVVFLLLVVLNGCGSLFTPIVSSSDILIKNDGYAYVIFSLEIGDGNFDEISTTLFADGDIIANYGIILADKYSETSIATNDSLLAFDGNLLRTQKMKKTYRVIKIDKSDVDKKEGNCLFYINGVAKKDKDGYVHIVSRTFTSMNPFQGLKGHPMPLGAPDYRNDVLPGSWEFFGCKFEINKPGIYYLGDLKLNGFVDTSKTEQSYTLFIKNGKHGSRGANMETEVNSNVYDVRNYIKDLNLPQLPLVDLAPSWKNIPGELWHPYASGKE